MKKRSRITACLVAGVLILAVSATAAFGSVGGYSQYKTAVMALALEEKNFSAVGNASVKLGDQEILTYSVDYAQDGQNRYTHSTTVQEGLTDEYYDGSLNGTGIWFHTKDKGYSKHEGATATETLMGFDKNDKTQQRIVSFLEISADTVVGELKNNFVQVGSKDGVDLYQVNIAQAQVPSLVNAGLSLFACAVASDSGNAWGIQYEDADATRFGYYEKVTGTPVPQEVKDYYKYGWTEEDYEAYQDEIDAFDQAIYGESANWTDEYNHVLDAHNGGIVYVHADGTYDYYADSFAYVEAHPEDGMNYLDRFIGDDMSLQNVDCTFGVDSKGNLTENHITVTFLTTDREGVAHTLVMEGQVNLTDYGTTTVTVPDVGNRTEEKH